MPAMLDWIKRCCEQWRLEEKWLLADNLTTGNQWKESLARRGHALVNLHSKTIRSIIIELTLPFADSEGLTLISSSTADFIVQRLVVEAAAKSALEYFGEVTSSQRLGEIVARSIQDLRMSGLGLDGIDSEKFEVADKAVDLQRILGRYLDVVGSLKLLDYAGCCELLLERMDQPQFSWPEARVLVPREIRLDELERRIGKRLGGNDQVWVYSGGLDASIDKDDASPEGFVFPDRPQTYAAAIEDGSAQTSDDEQSSRSVCFSYAEGEVNEVAAVVRAVVCNDVSMDDVEILHTDYKTYVPMIHEFFAGCPQIAEGAIEKLPLTFGEGMATIYSRPGRALRSWVRWTQNRFQQSLFVQMLREGVLSFSGESSGVGFGRLAGVFREVPIGFELERYVRMLKDEIARAQTCEEARRIETDAVVDLAADVGVDKVAKSIASTDTTSSGGANVQLYLFEAHDDVPMSAGSGKQQVDDKTPEAVSGKDKVAKPAVSWRVADLQNLLSIVKPIVRLTQEIKKDDQDSILATAATFLKKHARGTSGLDEIARTRLIEEIEAQRESLNFSPGLRIDAWGWLEELAIRTRVLASGPQPGKMHVDHIRRGGHSGRRNTFVLGLDDARYPNRGGQDPLLLDHERRKLSGSLRTMADTSDEAVFELYQLIAGLSGNVSLSYSVSALGTDTPQFASPVLMEVYRHESNDSKADEQVMRKRIGPCQTFSTWDSHRFLLESDWWYRRMLSQPDAQAKREMLESRFPHLAAAHVAAEQIESDSLTEFDGLVPEAVEYVDPTHVDARRTSATRMESLGACPRKYFFQSALRLRPPEEVVLDTARWLDPLSQGLLIHGVFETFLVKLTAESLIPEFDRDRERLQQILDERIQLFVERCPIPNQNAFQKQVKELQGMCDIFLREEQKYCQQSDSVPWILEPAIGVGDEEAATPLDCSTPVPLELSGGRTLQVGGRLDRIDRVGGDGSTLLSVWDYKSGSTYGFDKADPFREGRKLQAFLYVGMLRHRAREVWGSEFEVKQFGYFFPSTRANGQRIAWTSKELETGDQILGWLCDIIKGGAFVATNNKEDCRFCDFLSICGDPETTAESTGRMLGNPVNTQLQPLRNLRQEGAS